MKHSKTECIDYTHYCIYCGKEAAQEDDYSDHEITTSYYCTCKGAELELSANELLLQAKRTITTETRLILQELRFKYELKQLKQKYQFDIKNFDKDIYENTKM